ncbi:hypothetical protein [Escherichia phage CLB_P2]|nr:hypothetical protein [Escherichia phage CLB_P2]
MSGFHLLGKCSVRRFSCEIRDFKRNSCTP